jgi:hypothetical protein
VGRRRGGLTFADTVVVGELPPSGRFLAGGCELLLGVGPGTAVAVHTRRGYHAWGLPLPRALTGAPGSADGGCCTGTAAATRPHEGSGVPRRRCARHLPSAKP